MSAARPGIVRRTYASPGYCAVCEAAGIVTHYDWTIPGYICAACAPQAILIDLLLLTVGGCKHPNPHKIENN